MQRRTVLRGGLLPLFWAASSAFAQVSAEAYYDSWWYSSRDSGLYAWTWNPGDTSVCPTGDLVPNFKHTFHPGVRTGEYVMSYPDAESWTRQQQAYWEFNNQWQVTDSPPNSGLSSTTRNGNHEITTRDGDPCSNFSGWSDFYYNLDSTRTIYRSNMRLFARSSAAQVAGARTQSITSVKDPCVFTLPPDDVDDWAIGGGLFWGGDVDGPIVDSADNTVLAWGGASFLYTYSLDGAEPEPLIQIDVDTGTHLATMGAAPGVRFMRDGAPVTIADLIAALDAGFQADGSWRTPDLNSPGAFNFEFRFDIPASVDGVVVNLEARAIANDSGVPAPATLLLAVLGAAYARRR
ncbi:MAG: hypothetical protein ACOYN0_15880 [Phycisphaerales bacterium]